MVASWLLYGMLAPSVLAQGLLAGLAIYEMLTMEAPIDTPPNARVLYARSSTSFLRAHLLLGAASLVGSVVRALPRMRSGQYVLQPWRRHLDRASVLLYLLSICLSFSVRQLAWTMDSPVTVEQLPWYDPVHSPYFLAVFEGWRTSGPIIYSMRAACCCLGLMIAILPTGDHRYLPYSLTPPPPGGALARARRTAALVAPEAAALHPRHIPEDEEVHVLAPSEAGLERAGLAFAIGCWRFGTERNRAPPLPRAPDGGLPHLPVPERRQSNLASFNTPEALTGMDRPTYVSRMLRIVLLLSIDLVVEMTADSIHWLLHIQLNLVRDDPKWDIIVMDFLVFVATLFTRGIINITFFSMCVSTAYWKLGMLDRLKEQFGSLLALQTLMFFEGAAIRLHRVIQDFRDRTKGDSELFFWGYSGYMTYEEHKEAWGYGGKDIKDDGLIYSIHKAFTLLLLAPYCIWTFDSARRLGRSEYYLHPTRESELALATGGA